VSVSRLCVALTVLTAVTALDTADACTCVAEGEGPAPEIDVDACTEPVVDGGTPGRHLDCTLDFGTVTNDVRTERTIVITDAANVPLQLTAITIVGDPSFRLEPRAFDVVDAQSSVAVTVDVTPSTNETIKARLAIESNAANVDRNTPVEVTLNAN
jgi:hypothetical protein